MKKKHLREERAKRLFSVLLFVAWISFMAFAGMFIPSLIHQLPFFKIKEIEVSGNYKVDFEAIKETIEELSVSLKGLDEKSLTEALNERFEGRVKKVYMNRNITLAGIEVKLKIIERVPVAKVKLGNSFMLIDGEGVLFPAVSERELNLPEVRTHDVEVLQNHFYRLYDSIKSVKLPIQRIDVKPDRVVLVLKNKKAILPPLELLPGNISGRLKMIYNFSQETVDLRYGRFILVRN